MRKSLLVVSFLLLACGQKTPLVIAPQEAGQSMAVVKPTPSPSSTPAALFALSPAVISSRSKDLIVEYEVGGVATYNRHPYPEAPDARYSGITQGVGYDDHQNAPQLITLDWISLGDKNAKRLSETHPYYGRTAQSHLREVQDIMVPWTAAFEVFSRVDIARTLTQCRRTFPGFDKLRANAQGAICSLIFNRGNSTTGPGRSEVRDIRDYGVPKQDYARIAKDLRSMERLWRGTSIERGMTRRREAEATLVETP